MKSIKLKNQRRERRRARNRAKIFGVADKPRLSVFRSNQYLYAQLIDDERGQTLLAASTRSGVKKGGKKDQAKQLGEVLGEKMKSQGLAKVVFNKGIYKYHGRIQALVEGVRSKGIKI